MKFLMCRPEFFRVDYEINPWMHVGLKVDIELAKKQWQKLYETMLAAGAVIELITPQVAWPDMTFTANAGLYYRGKIILAHFKYSERQGEVPYFTEWFKNAGFETADPRTLPKTLYFEGAGDALLAGETLFAGFGFRSDKEFYATLPVIDQSNIVYCELVNPYFYHIDTCFCPLNDKVAIWYPEIFSSDTQKQMAEHIELIPVSNEEAKHFACNAIVINDTVILPNGCPELTRTLETRGFNVVACDMSEFLKAGGACKCLTLRIDA